MQIQLCANLMKGKNVYTKTLILYFIQCCGIKFPYLHHDKLHRVIAPTINFCFEKEKNLIVTESTFLNTDLKLAELTSNRKEQV